MGLLTGRLAAAQALGRDLDDCVVWDPHQPRGGLTVEQIRDARMILWRGHCSVHGRFTVDAVETARTALSDATRARTDARGGTGLPVTTALALGLSEISM